MNLGWNGKSGTWGEKPTLNKIRLKENDSLFAVGVFKCLSVRKFLHFHFIEDSHHKGPSMQNFDDFFVISLKEAFQWAVEFPVIWDTLGAHVTHHDCNLSIPNGAIDNKSVLVKLMMACWQSGARCYLNQYVASSRLSKAYMHQETKGCLLLMTPLWRSFVEICIRIQQFSYKKINFIFQNCGHFVLTSMCWICLSQKANMNLMRIFVNQIIYFLDSNSAGYHSMGFYRRQIMIGWFIEAEWRIYVSERYSISGSNNGLLPYWCQDIIGTNADLLLIGLLGTHLNGNLNLFR